MFTVIFLYFVCELFWFSILDFG